MDTAHPTPPGTGAPRSRLRRNLVAAGVLGSVLALWNGVPLVMRLLPQDFAFEPIRGLPGFRRLAGGAASGAFDPLAGIGTPGEARGHRIDPEALRADPCGALFGAQPTQGVVPVASFSDYYCPYCRILTRMLWRIEAESAGAVRVRWHEWPLLGPTSEVAARAALAAKRQGAYLAFHETLMRGAFVATPAFIASLAERIGVDPVRMVADMQKDETTREIETSRALAALFGMRGTPSLVVGRTVVEGEIDEARLLALIERERADGPLSACTTA